MQEIQSLGCPPGNLPRQENLLLSKVGYIYSTQDKSLYIPHTAWTLYHIWTLYIHRWCYLLTIIISHPPPAPTHTTAMHSYQNVNVGEMIIVTK